MKKIFFIIVGITIFFLGQSQTIRYVKLGGTGDGSSWDNSSSSIVDMVNESEPGDQVWIAGGTHNFYQDTYLLKEGVSIYGSFWAYETSIDQRERRDLDGNGEVEAWEYTSVTTLKGYNIVINQLVDFETETIVDGFIISYGRRHGVSSKNNLIVRNCIVKYNTKQNVNYDDNKGAGIFNDGGYITNCLITENNIYVDNNARPIYGAGIYNKSGTIDNCHIINNDLSSYVTADLDSTVYGAGVYNCADGIISNCIIRDNKILTYMARYLSGFGGGIYNAGGIVSNCNISNNTVSMHTSSEAFGGGIYNNGGAVSNCNINNNEVSSGGSGYAFGAGIYNLNGSLNNSEIINNRSTGSFCLKHGGGIYNDSGEIDTCTVSLNNSSEGGGILSKGGVVNGCTIESNSGGGIHGYGLIPVSIINSTIRNNELTLDNHSGGGARVAILSNCIIENNSAPDGGGLAFCTAYNCLIINNSATNQGGGTYDCKIYNCNIVGNTSNVNGGGVYMRGNEANRYMITNSIIWQNTAPTFSQVYDESFIDGANITYSAIQGGIQNLNSTECISLSSDNDIGGPMFVDPENNNYQLRPCSPCVNAGINDSVTNPATALDILGNTRIYSYYTSGIVDMGAYEFQGIGGINDFAIIGSIEDNNFVLSTDPVQTSLEWNNGETTASIIITNSGSYWVRAHDNNNCPFSDTVYVEIIEPLTICEGDEFNFFGNILTESGKYFDYSGDTFIVLEFYINPSPEIPEISRNDNLLISNGTGNHQWYEYINTGGSNWEWIEITGANQQTYTINTSGTYKVKITNEFNCLTFSEEINVCFIPQSEINALISIYNATNGEDWTNTWDIENTENVCNWHGIEHNGYNITKITLNNNNLSGELPSTLSGFSYLTELNLKNNRISGNLPDISNLENIEVINFEKNLFSGIIPLCYNTASPLNLNLSDNRLSTLVVTLNNNYINLNIKNQKIWSETELEIIQGENLIINLPNICTYRHTQQDFSGNNTFVIFLDDNVIGTINSEGSLLTIPSSILTGAQPGSELSITQSTGDAQGTIIYYNQGSGTVMYTIRGNITYQNTGLNNINIDYEFGTTATNQLGNYSFQVEANSSFTITPSSTPEITYFFNPQNILCENINSDLNDQNFIAIDQNICEISQQEINALIAIYNSTNGSSWTNTWDIEDTENICDWYGINVINNKIIGITLNNNNLTGTLSNEFNDLIYLESLNLSNNEIEGNLPNISRLENIRNINFEKNKFSGNIPAGYNLSLPLYLNLSWNRLITLSSVLDNDYINLNILSQEIWESEPIYIIPENDIVVILPNICTYDHYEQNFSATNTFNVLIGDNNVGTVTSENGRVIIASEMLSGIDSDEVIDLVQITGDASGTKIHYNQNTNINKYIISGKITYEGENLNDISIYYTGGSVRTDQNGNFSFEVEENSTITITPTNSTYKFRPTRIVCENVNRNITGQNFTAFIETGINKIDSDNVIIYPNPVSSILYINLSGINGDVPVLIYSLEGVKIYEQNFIGGSVQHINLENLVPGIYMIKIGEVLGKFIKQ